jgi:hypothetical protein
MERVAIVLLVVSLFAGCASSPEYEQTSKKLNDGTHYFIKTKFTPCQISRDWAVKVLTRRANKICKSKYILINEHTPVILQPIEAESGTRELLWEIKCKDATDT